MTRGVCLLTSENVRSDEGQSHEKLNWHRVTDGSQAALPLASERRSGAVERSFPFRMPPIEYGGMIRICRAATVEKNPGFTASTCRPSGAPGMLHMLMPSRWSGVVKYWGSFGLQVGNGATPAPASQQAPPTT